MSDGISDMMRERENKIKDNICDLMDEYFNDLSEPMTDNDGNIIYYLHEAEFNEHFKEQFAKQIILEYKLYYK